MCRILLVPPDQQLEGEDSAVGGGEQLGSEAEPQSVPQEVRIEMIEVGEHPSDHYLVMHWTTHIPAFVS